jgi:hypothetical protein
MSTLDDRRRLEELYLPSADDFVLVDVPDLQFVMIDGEGDPAGEAFARASRWLFAVIYPIKRVAKQRMGKRFVEPPLEGLWWAEERKPPPSPACTASSCRSTTLSPTGTTTRST